MGNFQNGTSTEKLILKRLDSIESRLGESLDDVKKQARENGESLAVTKLMNGSVATAICAVLILGSLAYREFSDFAHDIAGKIPFLESREERQETNFKIDETRLKNNDVVAGFRVSSQYLDPERDNHRGVDIAAPSGTKLYAPGLVDVKCYWDNGGGGNVAEFNFLDYRWQLLHLLDNSCKSGKRETGEVVGLIGNTGRSTGPHLHLQIRKRDNSFIEPVKGHLIAVLTDVSQLENNGSETGFIGSGEGSGNAYIDRIATETARRYGIPKNLIIAIAKHETGHFKAVIGNGNAWGLKCVGNHSSCVNTKTNEYNNGVKGTYDLMFESCNTVQRCSQILGNTLRNLNTTNQWEDINLALDAIGKRYATDPQWSNKVKQLL